MGEDREELCAQREEDPRIRKAADSYFFLIAAELTEKVASQNYFHLLLTAIPWDHDGLLNCSCSSQLK